MTLLSVLTGSSVALTCKYVLLFFVQSRLAYDKKQLEYERNRGQSEAEDKKARRKCQAASKLVERHNSQSCCSHVESTMYHETTFSLRKKKQNCSHNCSDEITAEQSRDCWKMKCFHKFDLCLSVVKNFSVNFLSVQKAREMF